MYLSSEVAGLGSYFTQKLSIFCLNKTQEKKIKGKNEIK
jgi:hypothetical protein